MRYYTGVGSRETPPEIMTLMTRIAGKLAREGWTLRSGGADGADWAFEEGWLDWFLNEGDKSQDVRAELFLPWAGFNLHVPGITDAGCIIHGDSEPIMQRAFQCASTIHPAWERLKPGAKKLHGRNVFQVLGKDLDTPSKFLVCWAPVDKHGVPKGGTRTAWVLAQRENIPCFNLKNEEDRRRIEKWLHL